MTDIHKQLGVYPVKQENTEISYEALTQRFDGRPPSESMLAEVVHHYELIREQVKARAVPGERTAMTELEIKKLAFLFRITRSLSRLGYTSLKTLELEAMKWLADE